MPTISSKGIHDTRIRLEPSLTEVAAERQTEFTCTIPTLRLDQQQQEKLRIELEEENKRWPEVSWKRNGRPLQVRWLNNGDTVVSSSNSARYLARQTKPSEFVLTLARVQSMDDNATFTCLYKWPSGFLPDSGGQEESELVRESSPIRLRVLESAQNAGGQVKIDANLARPIDDLANAKNPHELPADTDNNETNSTRLTEPATGIVVRRTLKQTLEDLYELAKPMLIIVGLLGFMSSIVLLYLTLIKRRRHNQNRYMKHQYVGSGASSNASSAIGGAPDCGDPVLSSLMARTLSAPSAVSLACATKKYRSYRDHMRKVAAVQDHMMVGAEGDFIDGYFGPPAPAHLQQISGSLSDQAPFFALPNLYNQSLAAREQARNLLQANEHMRSLSNLSQHQKQAGSNGGSAARQQQTLGQLGSHLNLPLSFALGGPNGRLEQPLGCQGNISSALWPPHLNQNQQHPIGRFNGQQNPNHQLAAKQRFADEQYQLVNCSSISPSSSNSGAASSGLSTNNDQDNRQMRKQAAEFGESNCARFDQHQSRLDSNSQNHYSTIENNDDEDRYEEVEQAPGSQDICAINQQGSFRTNRVSSFVTVNQGNEHIDTSSNANNILKNSTRSSILSNSSSSGCGDSTNTTTSSSLSGDIAANRIGSKRTGRQQNQSKTILQQDKKRNQQFQDQLSPYAVSSICSSIPPNHQPPPVPDSEAMQALYEQFDINQLMLLDESNTLPPPPPTDSYASSQIEDRVDRSQTRNKS